MKTLKQIPLLFSVIISLSSCVSYQYVTLTSNTPVQEDGKFKLESDSINIIYSFYNFGYLKLEIENKSDQLLYVDWEKSSIIIDKESIPMISDKEYFEGSTSTYSQSISVDFDGTIYKNPTIRYLPPNTHIVQNFPLDFARFITPEQLQSGIFTNVQSGGSGKSYAFDEETTPLKFQTYLYIGSDEGGKSMIQEQNFWTQTVFQTIDGQLNTYPNQILMKKTNPTGAVLGTMALLGVTIYLVNELQPDDELPSSTFQP